MANKELFCAPSLYSLFLYTLINENWTKSDFVLARIPDVIIENLRRLYNVKVYNYPVCFCKNPLKKIFMRNKHYFDYKKSIMGKRYEKVWGNDEFPGSFPFRKQGIFLIEDGAFNSYTKHDTYKRQHHNDIVYLSYWYECLFSNYVSYGWDDSVKLIYHTPSVSLPREIAHKGVLIDLKDKWESLSEIRKREIFDLFGIKLKFIEEMKEYTTVLVTQDLPIPDVDKIAIYKRMTEGMDMSKVLIKTHYAEKTDYSKVFPESTVISMPVPMQLFSLIGYNPSKVMTISSGAVGPFIKEGVEVVFLGTEVDPRIVAKYGVMTKETYMSNLKK